MNWEEETRKSIAEIDQIIEKLVKESKKYATANNTRIFLTLDRKNPYWSQGKKSKEGKWLRENIGKEITKRKLWHLGRFKNEVVKGLLEINQRANYLREIKRVLTNAKVRSNRINSSACELYARMMRNYEKENFVELGRQITNRKYNKGG